MKTLKKLIYLPVIMLLLIIASGCESDNVIPDIYASIYPIEFIVTKIVKDELNVKAIYPRGKDIHDYELSPQDMIKISKSKLVFYIGAGLESLIEQSKDSTLKDVPTICLSKGMDLVEINSEDVHNDNHHLEEEHEGVFYDPHIWLDLDKMQKMTINILDNIINTFELTEEQIYKFENNAAKLIKEFQDLDQEFFDLINSDDIFSKTIMVDHDAYIYWEVRYNLKRIRIRNDNDSTDAIVQEMIEKINLAKSKKIKFICLTKNEMTSAIADQYRVQLGLDTNALLRLHHLATITSQEEKNHEDYLSLMRYNLSVLEIALPRK